MSCHYNSTLVPGVDCDWHWFGFCGFQCENGHTACWSCCSKLKSECPSCKRPIGSIRCLALEKLIQSLNVKCKFANQGCTQMVKFVERSIHESNCSFYPHKCPFPECIFLGRFDLFKNHVAIAHPRNWQSFDFEVKLEVELKTSDRYYVLLSTDKYFLINREVTSIGDLCYLTYPRAPPPMGISFRYRLEVHIKSPSTMFTMHASCGSRKGEENRKGSAILIPRDQSMDLIVRIYKPWPILWQPPWHCYNILRAQSSKW